MDELEKYEHNIWLPKAKKSCKNEEEEIWSFSFFFVSISGLIFPAYFNFYMIPLISEHYLEVAILVKWHYNWCNNLEQKAPKHIKLLNNSHYFSTHTISFVDPALFWKDFSIKKLFIYQNPISFFNVIS